MEQTNCPNCGAPLTGCRCEYCGTVDPAMEAEIQRLRAKITELRLHDQQRQAFDYFVSVVGSAPLTAKKERFDYTIHNPAGGLVLQAPESCRYSRQVELELLAAGYIIRLHGRKITKKELTENVKNRR